MLNIRKSKEPKSLTEHRCHTDACYEQGSYRATIRGFLRTQFSMYSGIKRHYIGYHPKLFTSSFVMAMNLQTSAT